MKKSLAHGVVRGGEERYDIEVDYIPCRAVKELSSKNVKFDTVEASCKSFAQESIILLSAPNFLRYAMS